MSDLRETLDDGWYQRLCVGWEFEAIGFPVQTSAGSMRRRSVSGVFSRLCLSVFGMCGHKQLVLFVGHDPRSFLLGKKGHSRENGANIWFRHLREDVEERQIKSVQSLLWLPLWRQSATFILLQLLGWTSQTNDLVSRTCYLHWRIRPAMCSIIPAREETDAEVQCLYDEKRDEDTFSNIEPVLAVISKNRMFDWFPEKIVS